MKKKILMVVLVSCILSCSSILYGIFNHVDWGARVVGVGLGYVGCGDVDGSIVMWNGGGLGYIGSSNEIVGMYGIPFVGLGGIDLRYSMVSFVKGLGVQGGVGIGVGMFDGAGVWSENEYVIGYGRLIGSNLGIGLVLKYLEYKVKLNPVEYGDDPLLSKGGKGVVSGDIGLVYSLNKSVKIGCVVKDMLGADIGLSSEEKLGMSYLVGLNYIGGGEVRYILSLGYMGGDGESDYSIGGEVFLSGGRIIVRGSYSDFRYAIGGSYNLDKIRIDYTYAIPSQLTDTSGSHYVGVAFRF